MEIYRRFGPNDFKFQGTIFISSSFFLLQTFENVDSPLDIQILSSYRAVTRKVTAMKSNKLMVHTDITTVCSEIHKEHINSRCGQKVEFVKV